VPIAASRVNHHAPTSGTRNTRLATTKVGKSADGVVVEASLLKSGVSKYDILRDNDAANYCLRQAPFDKGFTIGRYVKWHPDGC
jgi:hypothetical protein